MTDAPPSRYHIVERGRRLVVIDRWHGSKPGSTALPGTAANNLASLDTPRPGTLRRTSFDGRAEFVTHPFYDRKGPRTLKLDASTAASIRRVQMGLAAAAAVLAILVFWTPWLIVPAVVLLTSSRTRAGMRNGMTALVDRLQARLGG